MGKYNGRGKSLLATIGDIASVVCAVKAVIDLAIVIREYGKQKSNQPDQG